MSAPVLHLLAGSNGAGKTTLAERILLPVTHLRFVNADHIAAAEWPDAAEQHAYEASRLADVERRRLLLARTSFVAETVFSHESKVELAEQATALGYIVHLHVVMIPIEVAVARVRSRVELGGHSVPEAKVRERYQRLWPLIVRAVAAVDRADFYDNSRAAEPFRLVGRFEHGHAIGRRVWPGWTPAAVQELPAP